jgi:hypothetical protein
VHKAREMKTTSIRVIMPIFRLGVRRQILVLASPFKTVSPTNQGWIAFLEKFLLVGAR